MKKVVLEIICRDEDSDYIEGRMSNSNIAQMGIYTMGISTKDCTKEDVAEVEANVPL